MRVHRRDESDELSGGAGFQGDMEKKKKGKKRRKGGTVDHMTAGRRSILTNPLGQTNGIFFRQSHDRDKGLHTCKRLQAAAAKLGATVATIWSCSDRRRLRARRERRTHPALDSDPLEKGTRQYQAVQ